MHRGSNQQNLPRRVHDRVRSSRHEGTWNAFLRPQVYRTTPSRPIRSHRIFSYNFFPMGMQALLDAGLDSFCVSSAGEDERDTSCLVQSSFPSTVSVGPSDERKRGRCRSRDFHRQRSPLTSRHTSARRMDGVAADGLSSPVGMLKDIRQLSLFRALLGAALYPQV